MNDTDPTGVLLAGLIVLGVVGCGRMSLPMTDGVSFKGTPEYEHRVELLYVQPKTAAATVVDFVVAEGRINLDMPSAERDLMIERYLRVHHLLINGYYHFEAKESKTGVSLDGFYVNGATGRVERRHGQGEWTYRELERRGWRLPPARMGVRE